MNKTLQAVAALFLLAVNAVQAASGSLVSPKPTVQYGPGKFVVTAYYSPLPDQKHYLKGSYEADIRLNGNGTHGASGKPVYAGMLAAPKHYSFGTTIFLEGVGFGTVDDRGGAIVKAGERWYSHDRIDVWMGSGEEGLRRALAWGKRTVSGRIYADGENVPESSVKLAVMPKVSIASLVTKPVEERIWIEPVGPNSSSGMILALAVRLHEIGYLESEPSSVYDVRLKRSLAEFQKSKSLLKGDDDSNAGYYGPATRKALKAVYAEKLEEKAVVAAELADVAKSISKAVSSFSKESQDLKDRVEAFGTPKDGESGAHVRSLQEALVRLGYFEGKSTGIYGPKTKEAVANFQIARKLIIGKKDPNAGKLGKLTKSALLLSLAEKSK